jgi:hypothetical protein
MLRILTTSCWEVEFPPVSLTHTWSVMVPTAVGVQIHEDTLPAVQAEGTPLYAYEYGALPPDALTEIVVAELT